MLLCEMNPFIRFASQSIIYPQKSYLMASDCRIFYILEEGIKGIVQIGYNEYRLKKNSFIFISAGTPYKFVVDNPIKIISINFDFSQYRNQHTLPFEMNTVSNLSNYKLLETRETFDDCDVLNGHMFLDDGTFALALLNNVIQEYAFRKIHFHEASSAVFKLLLINALDTHAMSNLYINSSYIKNANLISKVKQFIQTNYKDDISNESIARHVDYHSYYLNRIFQKSEGVSIHKYLNDYRLIMAEKLLLETDESITFIATEIGFNSVTSFNQNFKAKHSLTPLKYRNLHKK